MLTHQQNHLLTYLEGYYDARGVMPTFDEMRIALDLRSKSGIHRLLGSLEERGRIRRLRQRARAIELVRTPRGPIGPARIPFSGPIGPGIPDLTRTLRHLTVPEGLLGPGEHVVLAVVDDAMRGAGILPGDLAVIRRQAEADDGAVALVVVDGTEACLRRLQARGGAVALKPDNPALNARVLSRDRVRVLGRLASILRDYR